MSYVKKDIFKKKWRKHAKEIIPEIAG